MIYNEYEVLRRQMPIGEQELFDYVIPALLFLFAGVFIFNRDIPILECLKRIDRKDAANLGHLLVSVSLIFDGLDFLNIPGVHSIHSFTYYLKFSGAMCYFFAPSTPNYAVLFFVFLSLVQHALYGGVFIDFFMWSTYLFIIVSLRYELSFKIRLSFILLAAPVLIIVQSVKSEYREATWNGKRETGIGLVKDLAQKKQEKENDPFERSDGVVRTVGRLNQGWHLGKVLRWVPKHEPFSGGDDILGDIEGTVLPRIFFPDKKIIGSQEKFYRYTGHKLTLGTSMTIGVLGDFYVNFGRWGSFFMLFVFGAFAARALHFFVRKYVLTDPINVIWIPYLFSYLVRANNDFYIVFNNLVKGFLIFLFINYVRRQIWPSKVPVNRLLK
ncbi:MAG: hypothetical protein ACKVOQ_20890 [Cyclobacteriaceae bacterium]